MSSPAANVSEINFPYASLYTGKPSKKEKKEEKKRTIKPYLLMVALSASIEVSRPASTLMVRSSISSDT